jgi:hypothetical protein
VLVVLGTIAGMGLQAPHGVLQEAQQRVFVRDNRSVESAGQADPSSTTFSLDTEAQIVRSDAVVASVKRSTNSQLPDADILARLRVTAVPNTRILVLHVHARGPRSASEAAASAGKAYLDERTRLATSYRDGQIGRLGTRSEQLNSALQAARDRLPQVPRDRSAPLRDEISRLVAELRAVDLQHSRLINTDLDPGQVIGTPSVKADYDPWIIAGVSGCGAGFLVWALFVWLLGEELLLRRRLAYRSSSLPRRLRLHRRTDHDPRLLCTAKVPDRPTIESLRPVRDSVTTFGPVASVLSTGAPLAAAAARMIEEVLPDTSLDPSSGRVVLVADATQARADVDEVEHRLSLSGLEVIGIVALERG